MEILLSAFPVGFDRRFISSRLDPKVFEEEAGGGTGRIMSANVPETNSSQALDYLIGDHNNSHGCESPVVSSTGGVISHNSHFRSIGPHPQIALDINIPG